MRFALPHLALCAWALAVAPVAAQAETESVLLLAPPEVRAEWTAALQLELAARGAVVLSADAPHAPTALIGDAAAQRMAVERAAQAAVWVEPREEGWRLRMVRADAERPRVVPVARDADARTVALIVVSLLEGAAEPPPALVPEPAMDAEHDESAEPPAPSAGIAAAHALSPPAASEPPSSSEPPVEGPVPRRGPYVRWSGLIGLSAFLRTNDVRLDPGFTLRAGIAMRYDWFEAAILHDLGLAFEKPVNTLLPMGRVCVDVGATTARLAPAFHAGVRGCMGSLFATVTINDRVVDSALRTHASGGGYLAVSLPLLAWIRLFIRADLDVGWTDTPQAPIELLPTLSTFLSFD